MAVKRATKRKARKASKPKKAKKKVARRVKRNIRKRRVKRKTKKSQTGTMRRVWNGTAMYTKGGLMKKDLCINKRGKVVSKKAMLNGKRAFKGIRGWLNATEQARKQLG